MSVTSEETTAHTNQPSRAANARAGVQRFGTFLSSMIMPNIGAFIAWGIVAALFIEKGPFPVEQLGGFGTDANGQNYIGLSGAMVTYLLPLLIAYTGGRMIHDVRGGVIGAIATTGVIVGAPGVPMFIGAMIMGPLAAWVMKKLDALWDGKIRPGFEMLVNNFSIGITGFLMAILGFYAIAPVVERLTHIASTAIQFLIENHLLPLTSILIEPAKVLFLNNAINHGVMTPLGIEQAAEQGKSILFLLEANPGPGLGLLLAFMFFGRGAAKASAGGAAIIHFFGGIHEIYFPYVLAKPILILATIAGGATGIATNVAFNSGLRAPAAPGSIIAIYANTPPDSFLGVTLSVILSTTVSFIVAAIILRASKNKGEGDLGAATARMEQMKGKKSSVSSALVGSGAGAAAGAAGGTATIQGTINNIVFACDAGMGSSAMGASVLRRKIKDAGFDDVKVTNSAISNLKDDYDVVVVHQDLAARAEPKTPSATHVTVDNFMGSPRYDEIVELLQQTNGDGASDDSTANDAAPASAEQRGEAPAASAGTTGAGAAATGGVAAATADNPGRDTDEDDNSPQILDASSIVLSGSASDQAGAIDEAGQLLVDAGAVESGYVAAMHEREASVPTYMGNFLAIPHGTNEAKGLIERSAVSVVRYPGEIDWGGKPVKFVIGIAGRNKEHLTILSSIAKVFSDKDEVARLENATSEQEVLDIFGKVID